MRETRTRQRAHELGLVKFWPVKLCRNGHDSERYTSTNNCLECLSNKAKAFRKTPWGMVRLEFLVHADDVDVVRILVKTVTDNRQEIIEAQSKLAALAARERVFGKGL